MWLNWQMWTRCKLCDSCQIAPATVETESFKEISAYIRNPVLREEARFQGMSRGGITSENGSYQEIMGRITRYPKRRTEKVPPTPHRDITLAERWMDSRSVCAY